MKRIFALAVFFAAFSQLSSMAQSVETEGRGYTLSFSINADSATCSLSGFHAKEGGAVDVYVPEQVLNGSRKVSVTSIGDGASAPFQGSDKVRSVSLPASLKSVTASAFALCPNLSCVRVAAPLPPSLPKGAFLKNKMFGTVDSLYVPASLSDVYHASAWGKAFSDVYPFYTFSFEKSSLGHKAASVVSQVNFSDIFFAFNDANSGVHSTTDVTIARGVNFRPVSYGNSDLRSISKSIAKLPFAPSYSAHFKGQSISNLSAAMCGLFGNVKFGGTVDNLVLDNALMLIDPDNEVYQKSDDGKTLFVHIFAGRNNGSLNTVGFYGSVIMDKNAKVSGVEKFVVTLVGVQGGQGSVNGFLYLTSDAAPSSRSVTPLVECKGVGVDESLASKVAIRSGGQTKPFDHDDSRFRYTSCAFSDDEFANGTVAYWLNCGGLGFDGDYKPTWRQGLQHPEPESNPAKALYKIEYQIDGDSKLTSAPLFANGGDRVTISYSQKPLLISVGGQSITPGETSTTFAYTAKSVVAISWSNANFKPSETSVSSGPEILVKGSLVTVKGAGKQMKGLYTVTGIKICETTGSTLSAPKTGVYMVRIGKRSWRILVK